MPNFRLLGNTLIDFSQVRAVGAEDDKFTVVFNDNKQMEYDCKDAVQVLKDSFAEFERADDERFPLRVAQVDERVQ